MKSKYTYKRQCYSEKPNHVLNQEKKFSIYVSCIV
jgi:hypothetical protein